MADPSRPKTIVAEEDEQIMGFAGFGANRNNLGTDTGELHGLYVDPDYWSRGIGAALLLEAEAWLAQTGYQRAILWTLADSARTRRFYEGRGWQFDGVSDTHQSGVEVVRYSRPLNAEQRQCNAV